MPHNDIKEWIGTLVGPGTKFRSSRSLSIAAGLSQSTVTNIWETGRGDPESLGKIADTVGQRRAEVFLLAGWLKPADLNTDITDETNELAELYFALPQDARTKWVEWGETLGHLIHTRGRSYT